MSRCGGSPRGWTDIGSDVCWDDHGGKWAKKARDGSYYVLDFTNMIDACGRDADPNETYICEVKRVDLPNLSAENRKRALDCVGLTETADGVLSYGGDIIPKDDIAYELTIVEACVSYGCVEPLDSFSGRTHATRVRANARRSAEALMRDAQALETALDRPVNKIGSTAREYGRGDIDAALNRGPFDTSKNLMRKLHGLPPGEQTQ